MGVQNLWKVLEKGDAVEKLKGDTQFRQIAAAVENKVVAVDLSAWLMQAQTQPALLANYDSPYARAAKVVFDRTIHWLRHGCLPVFVIEGQTPQAKLDKLRQRCDQQFGQQRRYDVGNRAGGQFDRLGQAMKRLLESFGVPCVQAVGEGEAMCAALNICGWAHACHTLDVDALLFGAITVYRQMHLLTDKPKEAELTICRREDVQHVLGISSGGDAALTAVAQLAGGDYDLTGVENVGEVLALAAVRHLLKECENDDTVLQKLEAAIAAGSNPDLDALKHCTGCKACGHESGTKSTIKQHPAKRGCAACGCTSGCIQRDFDACECEFHRRAEERLLNRVVRLAEQTPGVMSKCRLAADTYKEQLHLAISAVQREYGLAQPGSDHNVFRWMHRPDVRKISDFMCKYISDWEHHQVRLKLLPLLLEWDVRQGPRPSSLSGVQFRPTSIRQVSAKGAEDGIKDVPKREQQGWRYILTVERLTTSSSSHQQYPEDWAAEDLAIDQAWLDNTARSRPKQEKTANPLGLGGSIADDDEQGHMYSQGPFPASQATQQHGFDSYTECISMSQAAAGGSSEAVAGSSQGGRSGGKAAGSLQFGEHRSVRCSLIDSVWPELVEDFRNPPATSGRAKKSGGGRKKTAAAAAAVCSTQQRNLKDFFGTTKDPHTAAKPGAKPSERMPAGHDGSIIPGLAGITGASSQASAAAQEQRRQLSAMTAAAALSGKSVAGAAGVHQQGVSSTNQGGAKAGQGFMDWLESQHAMRDECTTKQHSPAPQLGPTSSGAADDTGVQPPVGNNAGPAATAKLLPSAKSGRSMTKASGSSSSSRNTGSPKKLVAASGCNRGRSGRQSKLVKCSMPPGALDRYVQKPQQHQQQQQQQQGSSQEQQLAMLDCQEPQRQQQEQVQHQHPQQQTDAVPALDDTCDSPDILPLAARLARARATSACAAAHGSCLAAITEPSAGRHISSATATAGPAVACVVLPMPRPAKKASTVREKERLCSPLNSPQKPQGPSSSTGSPLAGPQQQQAFLQQHTAVVQPSEPRGHFSEQYLALMHEVGGPSSPAGVKVEQTVDECVGRAAKGLFKGQQEQHQQDCIVVDLLDGPAVVAPLPRAAAAAVALHMCSPLDIIDLT